MQEILTLISEYALSAGVRLLAGIVVLVVGLKLSSVISRKIRDRKPLDRTDKTVRTFIVSFVSILLKVLVVVTAAAILGVPMTSIVAVISSVGLAIGLAVQGSLSNVAGGLVLLMFKPFKVGDFIDTDEGSGTVEEINIYHTILRTVDNKRLVIPNGIISNQQVTDADAYDTRRVDLKFSVAYDSDIEKVKKILLDCADRHELAFKDPAPTSRMSRQGDSSLEFYLRVWCKTGDYWTVYSDLLEEVKHRFDKEGISIPFPQLDVHLDKEI